MRLCERISRDKLWSVLEQATIQIVIAGSPGNAPNGKDAEGMNRPGMAEETAKPGMKR